ISTYGLFIIRHRVISILDPDLKVCRCWLANSTASLSTLCQTRGLDTYKPAIESRSKSRDLGNRYFQVQGWRENRVWAWWRYVRDMESQGQDWQSDRKRRR